MATIVESLHDKAVYILLGAGFGAYKAIKSHWLFGNLGIEEDSDNIAVLAVSDFQGKVGWIRTDQVRIISVDGQSPEELLLQTPDPTS